MAHPKGAERAVPSLDPKDQYRVLFENIQEPVVLRRLIFDEKGEIVDIVLEDANLMYLETIGGRPLEEVRGKSFTQIYNAQFSDWVMSHVRRVMSSNQPVTEERYWPMNDHYYLTTSVPLGKEHTFSTGLDITERKKVEAALSESNEYLERLIGYANAPIIVWDPDYVITRFNHAFELLTGIEAKDAIGSHLSILFPEDSKVSSMELIRHAMAGKQWDVVEIPIKHRSGQTRTVVWNSANVMGEDGLMRTIAQGQDITEKKIAERALRESNEYLERLIGYANAPIIVWNPECIITRFNHAFENLSGISSAEAVGSHLSILFPENSKEASMELIHHAMEGKQWDVVEIPIQHRSGQIRTVVWNSANIMGDDAKARATIAQGQDITERKWAEAALREYQQRLQEINRELQRSNAELQQFAYVASHDLREPLRMISSFLGLLQDRYDGKVLDAKAKEYIAFAVDGASRMQQLIDDILAYSRVETKAKMFSAVDMEEVLGIVRKDLLASIESSGATINSALLPNIVADQIQMVLLLENLIGNSMKFHSEVAPVITISVLERHGDWVFSVRDNGIGIPKEQQSRVFQMFQRLHTRDEYQGTGIGLAICKKIVERHGGTIWLESEEGKGSTFFFSIAKWEGPELYGS